MLIHGLSVPSIIWQDVAPQLAAKGFRTLVYGQFNRCPAGTLHDMNSTFIDLYGRGYSDAPQMTYDVSLYVTQLALLLQFVGWDKVDIAGISMVSSYYGDFLLILFFFRAFISHDTSHAIRIIVLMCS